MFNFHNFGYIIIFIFSVQTVYVSVCVWRFRDVRLKDRFISASIDTVIPPGTCASDNRHGLSTDFWAWSELGGSSQPWLGCDQNSLCFKQPCVSSERIAHEAAKAGAGGRAVPAGSDPELRHRSFVLRKSGTEQGTKVKKKPLLFLCAPKPKGAARPPSPAIVGRARA